MMMRDYPFALNNTATLTATIDEDAACLHGVLIHRPEDDAPRDLDSVLGPTGARQVREAVQFLLADRAAASARTGIGHIVKRGPPGPGKMFIHD